MRWVSGGQTGVDRAALDVALARGLPCGGWCPKGRRAEDGALPAQYPLRETPHEEYAQRTEWNVRDSDGTLILNQGPLEGGTALTEEIARRLGKPCLIVDLEYGVGPTAARQWVEAHQLGVVNIAGPRESKQPGIGVEAFRYLRELLCHVWSPGLSGGLGKRKVEVALPKVKKPAKRASARR